MASEGGVYSADSIEILSVLEAIRRRPGMYIGGVGSGGVQHMLWEVVANSLDEHLAGRASRIRVSLEGQLAEVEDDGAGIPVARDPRFGASILEWSLTTLHRRPTVDGHLPHVHVSPSRFGLGIVVVNALSESLEVESRREGYAWHQRYERGVARGPIERGARTERTGTRLRFHVDRSIFRDTAFDRVEVRERLQELAWFNPDLELDLMTERLRAPDGIAGWVAKIVRERRAERLDDVCVTRGTCGPVFLEVALAWSNDERPDVRFFVGQTETPQGSHVDGFWKGLALAVLSQGSGAYTRPPRARDLPARLAGGLTAICHVSLVDPRFAGPTRERLVCHAARNAVCDAVARTVGAFLAERPRLARAVRDRLRG